MSEEREPEILDAPPVPARSALPARSSRQPSLPSRLLSSPPLRQTAAALGAALALEGLQWALSRRTRSRPPDVQQPEIVVSSLRVDIWISTRQGNR